MQQTLVDNGWPAWRARAECHRRVLPTEAFYPTSADRENWDPRVLEACAACPAATECLQWALAHNEQGIWAATDEEARRRLRRKLSGHA